MIIKTIDIHQFKAQLIELSSSINSEDEIVVTVNDIPLARIVPIPQEQHPRIAGLHPQAFSTSEDFDEPLEVR